MGVEQVHVVRKYHFLTPASARSDEVAVSTPTVVGHWAHDKDINHITGVGAELLECQFEGGNSGAEALALMPGGELLVFCEHNKPGAPEDTTIGWLANRETGAIHATYSLPLPPISEVSGKFYRVSGATSVPGTQDVIILFHYWSRQTGNMIKLGRATVEWSRQTEKVSSNESTYGRSTESTHINVSIILDMKEKDGYILDNFEAVVVARAGETGSYVIHLLSDNNFNENYQKTLLLSLHLQDGHGCQEKPKAQQEYLSTPIVPGPNPNNSLRAFFLPAAVVAGIPAALYLVVARGPFGWRQWHVTDTAPADAGVFLE